MSRRVALAVGALALIVGGCSHEDPTPEEAYISQAHEDVPESEAVPDKELIAYGEAVCDALEAGVTVEELGIAIGYQVMDAEVAGMLGELGAIAVIALCPEVLENGG